MDASIPVIMQAYYVCTTVGTLSVIAMAALGAHHSHLGHGAHGGHTSIGHGHGGVGHGQGGSHGPARGGATRGGTTHHAGSHNSTSHSSARAGQGQHSSAAHHADGGQGDTTQQAGAKAQLARLCDDAAVKQAENREEFALKLLSIFNPTTISVFAATFGASGLIASALLPQFALIATVPVAAGGGVLLTRILMTVLSAAMSRMYESSTFTQASLIGYRAEVTVPFDDKRMGEITCTTGGPRYTVSARATGAGMAMKRGDAVMICDFRDDVAYVEPWKDLDELDNIIDVPNAKQTSG